MRKSHSASFKFKVALAAIKGDSTIAEICQKFEVASSLVHKWKKDLQENGSDFFDKAKPVKAKQPEQKEVEQLYQKIGELTVERDFLKKSWEKLNS